MSKYVIALLASVFTLLFSFQNCQKSIQQDDLAGQVLNITSNPNEIQLSQESLQSIDVFLPDSKTITNSGHTYQINYNIILKIDLVNGEIQQSTDVDGTTGRYCLTEPLKNELLAILRSSKICKTQPSIPAGIACTQAIKLPYANLITAREQFSLGSASDGCGSNAIDLCGEHKTLLKGFIENIKSQYQNLTCK